MYLSIFLAAIFCLLAGRNDGSTIIAVDLRTHWRASAIPIALLAASVALMPLLNADVGHTVTGMLTVAGITPDIRLVVILASTSVTLIVLNCRGVPTSITLALVGASSGMRFACGDYDAVPVLKVLGVAFLAPFIAFGVSRVISQLVPDAAFIRSSSTLMSLGFLLLCAAYGANDGQKMAAVLAQALHVSCDTVITSPYTACIAPALFAVGTILGMRTGARAVQRGTIVPNTMQTTITIWAAACSVFISSALGSPVSMTQSISGALVGTCPAREWKRVRWNEVRRIAVAWIATLPSSWIIGFAATMMLTHLPTA